ncbi:galactoseinhibitable lectin small subunit, putative [Entamoeba histolytica KU27]|uniref:Galactoseinhibitable lectin small subunit, putative n=1 Tax=Entamoeba histolytica KU27 TaxID=885311 RepID=M2R6M6_ENTHI|nr:galactoseinhibitable lectin small subunit, putative [Entamoeba histolytica KU27]
MIFILCVLLVIHTTNALIDEKVVVQEIIQRDKCETCCRVLFAMEYDPTNNFEKLKDSSDRYVLDVEFETMSMLRIDINAYNTQQMRVRKLTTERELQYWEFASYQMICLYSYPNRVMDMLYNTKFGNPLIIWRRKEPLLESTNNQRFVYIYDYPFTDSRHKPYVKAFIAEYYVPSDCSNWWYCNEHQISWDYNRYAFKEMCYEVDDDNVKAYCGSAYNECNVDGYYKGLKAQDCVNEKQSTGASLMHAKKQKFIPIFA